MLGMCLLVDINTHLGFPGGSASKNSPADARDVGSILGSGRAPGEGNGNPLPWAEEPGRLQSTGLQRVRHN